MGLNYSDIRNRARLGGEGKGDGNYYISWGKVGEGNIVSGRFTGERLHHPKDTAKENEAYWMFQEVKFEETPNIPDKEEQYFDEAMESGFIGLSFFEPEGVTIEPGKIYHFEFKGKKKSQKSAYYYNDIAIYPDEQEEV